MLLERFLIFYGNCTKIILYKYNLIVNIKILPKIIKNIQGVLIQKKTTKYSTTNKKFNSPLLKRNYNYYSLKKLPNKILIFLSRKIYEYNF